MSNFSKLQINQDYLLQAARTSLRQPKR
uniref:Uncharacterized protein n=1 Tax=Arundo donax TaxID=35708 RepID=A0A0A9F091_ARUDO